MVFQVFLILRRAFLGFLSIEKPSPTSSTWVIPELLWKLWTVKEQESFLIVWNGVPAALWGDARIFRKCQINLRRGIAGSQLGIMKRLFYLNLDRGYLIINPWNWGKSKWGRNSSFWDDCIVPFQTSMVKVARHESLTLDLLEWKIGEKSRSMACSSATSELIQARIDHLKGISLYHGGSLRPLKA